jgi:uncharacterized protein (TIGR01777 family)
MKIALTGGSGFIGTKLTEYFIEHGHRVVVLDLVPPRLQGEGVLYIRTNLIDDIPKDALATVDAIIHLAGVNIFGRWTEDYKKKIIESRIATGKALLATIRSLALKPKVFVSASAVGYYGDGGEKELTEDAPVGNDFLAKVCGEWEALGQEVNDLGMRFVAVRTGIVIGKNGGMLAKLLPLFKFGLGGSMGTGKQWFSWIALSDLVRIYAEAVDNERLNGPVNAVAPTPVRNRELAQAIARSVHRFALLRVPAFLLHRVLGELAGVIVMSQRVIPKKLEEQSFVFNCRTINEALKESI